MTRMNTYLFQILVIAMMIASFDAHAQSDSISIDVEVSRTRVYIGDELTYQVVVRGVANPPTPEIAFPPSVRVQFRGRSSQSFTTMRMIQGRNRSVTDRLFSYQYTLTAVGAGEVVIPAPTVEVNGHLYHGKAASFESLFPAESDTDFFEMNIERNDLYFNETIVVDCVWWIGDNTTEFNFSSSYFPDSFVFRGMDLQSGNAQRVGFQINSEKLVGVLLTGQHDGKEMNKLVFRFTITPTELGVFDLGPIRTIFTRRSGTGGSYRSYVEAEPIVVSVKELPTENQPEGYNGAIGTYSLQSSASNTVVNVGDPIVLTLNVEGEEPMTGVDNAPDLSEDQSFSEYFKVSSEGWRESLPRRAGLRNYEITIRALNEHVLQIPPIKLPSFHPESNSYRVFQSQPIDILVYPVEEITLSDAVIGSNTSHAARHSQSIEHTELTPAMPALWAHGSVNDLLSESSFSIESKLNDPLMIGLAVSGPSVFAISLLIATSRRSFSPRKKALRRAWKTSRSLDRQGQHAQAFHVYIAAALGINADAVTAQDVARLPLIEEDAHAITSCLLADENGGFIGEGCTDGSEYSPRPELLRDVHRQILNAGETS